MKKITFNISEISNLEKEKIISDLAASGIAFQERHNMSVLVQKIANKQPEHLLSYFYKRLDHYRAIAKKIKRSFL
ncbi:DNA polymerase III, theta subunit [Wigglesworthia glossinidia endosymbiont of Glossina morsitans morsitans (Yale colony)]|uniref:DNA polymerase III, theta subunit n=1 Tax=Wigglesworthia glossinidia endosymbiont of Glossina morsitans morsitans (Yale colony) TaxID=1142511 RepID=H6Q5A1_WIGGL|nr:DNA polymerase III subunit theta [Wigglesworthia glossinidia]AFA41384.1 DNA polymerase III, theta subunit [Wigglesworthia glossinidia endosymbiont of Glossina morsitans morsitans (Yale colony)]